VTRTGWIVVAAALCAGVTLVVDRVSSHGAGARSFYPSSSGVLAVAMLVAGVALAVSASRGARPWRSFASAVAAVTAAQLAGMGLVAFKHWKTHAGYGANVGNVTEQRALAALMALTCAAALIVVAWRLVTWGDIPARVAVVPRWAAAAGGLSLVLWLPGSIGGSLPDNHDATSLVAYALIYSLPWGVAVALSGWTARPTALTGLLAVSASAALASNGEPMIDLVLGHQAQHRPFAIAAAVALAVAGLRLVWTGPTRRTDTH
jgi:hypothetical protein